MNHIHYKIINIDVNPYLSETKLKLIIHILVIILTLQIVSCGESGLKTYDEQEKNTEVTVTPVLASDTTPPTVILIGNEHINLTSGETYVELGATATDDSGEVIDVVIIGFVPHQEGEYTIYYSATDSSNNTSIRERLVTVPEALDLTPPKITLNGENAISLVVGESYVELGATAYDERDGIINVTSYESVDTSTLGAQNVVYTASDSSGNTSSVIRTVSIAPNLTNAFITTWKTEIPGSSIMIPTSNNHIYNFQVNWGDGSFDYNVTEDITHNYTEPGLYTISITGEFPKMSSSYSHKKLMSVEQWGNIQWQSMRTAFYQCTNLVINAVDTPDLSQVTDMSEMFSGATALNQNLDSWDVSTVTNMQGMFKDATSFNKELNNWQVSSVVNMSEMFQGAKAFNQPLNRWDVSSVKEMWAMFKYASEFNQPLNDWDVSSVTEMWRMFYDAESFNQLLDNWDVSSVTHMNSMFYQTSISTQNYDALLLAWSEQKLKFFVNFSAGDTTYSSTSADARYRLIDYYEWEISDGGLSP